MFDKNTTFLITGGAGFIGSNLSEHLIQLGVKIRILDDFSTGKEENLKNIINHPNIDIQIGDITNLPTCHKVCTGIDYVLHHAALGSVPKSIEDPMLTHHINTTGTLNMLMAAKSTGVKRFIYASSSAVYGDGPQFAKKEGDEAEPLSPYAVSKLINELHAHNFHKVYGLETIGLRYFNVFGKRQDPHSIYAAVIPIFVQKLLNNEAPQFFGDGMQSRDFTHIDNVIEANIKACLAPSNACAKAYNIACGEKVFLKDLYSKISDLLQKDIQPFLVPERPGDIKHSTADIQKAIQAINYQPQTTWEDGLTKSIQWYKDHLQY